MSQTQLVMLMKTMLKLGLAVSLAYLLNPTLQLANAAVPEPAFKLVTPADKVGVTLDRQSNEASLRASIGKQNVKSAPIGTGEGETMPGLILFQKSTDRVATVIWKDSTKSKAVGTLQIAGPKTLWRTNFGLSIGMRLKDVEKINGKPFKLAGFDWDGGGRATNWNGGILQKQLIHPKASVMVQFAYREKDKVPDSLLGDNDIMSSNPKMQALNPHIEALSINYQ
jgi:hypothetical protein